MPEPDVAVILPYRDAVKYLPRCVNSIINQTFQNFELILINDGSTDGSREFAESVRDPRIRIIDLPAAGLVAALNEGIFSTKARYLALLDPYDTARPDRLEKQYHYFELHEDIEVVSSRVRYLAERAGKNLKPYIDWTNRITRHEEIYNKRFVNSTVLHSTLMFKRELINTYGSFEDGEFPEDYEILLRWMNEGVSFAKLDDELTEWHDDVQRLSRRHTKYNSEAASKIKIKFFSSWYRGYFRTPPDILLWGLKHKEKDWLAWLEKEGLNIAGYIDHDSHKSWYEDKPVFGIEEIPARTFIIFFMEQFDPGDIPGLLTEKGLEEGTDFITMG